MDFKEFYFKHYKLFILVPVFMLLISVFIIYSTYNEIGDIINKDISLKGGVSLTIISDKDTTGLEQYLSQKFNQGFAVRKLAEFGSDKQIGFVVEASDVKSDDVIKAIEERLQIELDDNNLSIEETGSTLGEGFYRQMLKAILFAFLFMAIVVFITFRNVIPSLAVMMSGIFDLAATIAVLDLIGLKISTAGVAALLLILGYSIDTDVVLTTRTLKRKEGEVNARIINAFKTGLTMAVTTFIALLIGYLITNSYVVKEMFLIIMIGLVFDIIITWIFNAGILKWYLEKKGDSNA
nr:hypothetical protein [Candidatus Woesearchaeota archaeon]